MTKPVVAVTVAMTDAAQRALGKYGYYIPSTVVAVALAKAIDQGGFSATTTGLDSGEFKPLNDHKGSGSVG